MNQNITTIPESNLYVPNTSSEGFNLEKRVKNPFKDTKELMGMNKQPGRFKKYFSLTLAGLAMLLNVGMNAGCVKSDVVNNNKPSYATIILEDVFTKAELIGKVVANGTEGQSWDRYRIDSKVITSIEVDVKGYKSTYLLGVKIREGEKIEFARDKNGTFKKLPVNGEITLYLRLIPDSFDTVTLAKSIGNPVDPNTGDGTVIRYDKRNIDVALWEAEVAAGDAEQNLKDAINTINRGNSIITLNYKGKVNSYITNGVTHIINKDQNPVHDEEFDKKTYIISRSDIKTMPTASFSAILEELTQASTGLRADGGSDQFPYESQGQLINDASRAIYLVNFSPPGFQYSSNNPDPAALQTIMVFTTVADQIQEDAIRENSYVKPLGVDRMPSDYNGPGRFQHKRADKRHRR